MTNDTVRRNANLDPADDIHDRTPSDADEHEGASETEVGDLSGPGAGYDNEPEQEKDTGGVAES
jgi:hypothetical protein